MNTTHKHVNAVVAKVKPNSFSLQVTKYKPAKRPSDKIYHFFVHHPPLPLLHYNFHIHDSPQAMISESGSWISQPGLSWPLANHNFSVQCRPGSSMAPRSFLSNIHC